MRMEGADWREVAWLVLHINPDSQPDRARRAFESHLRQIGGKAWIPVLASIRLASPRAARRRMSLKFAEPRPYTDPDAAARKLIEIASTIEPVQNGRIYIELVNAGFMRPHGGSGPEFGAVIKFARATLARDAEHSLGPAGPIRWAISASVGIAQ